jgi:hypothetical protein
MGIVRAAVQRSGYHADRRCLGPMAGSSQSLHPGGTCHGSRVPVVRSRIGQPDISVRIEVRIDAHRRPQAGKRRPWRPGDKSRRIDCKGRCLARIDDENRRALLNRKMLDMHRRVENESILLATQPRHEVG